ncbi:MAG: LytTR family transcriptional regulator DNA-binding domain-containing protein [Bacteroidales bacterium]|nr:LytTR family transcriptional regulator DNA-binding domain-containing protein [Bacteroidales bacterium]
MQNNTGIPKAFFRFPAQIVHFVGLPVFFLLFLLVFRPAGIIEFLDAGVMVLEFNVTILSTILLLILVGTRLTFFFLRKKMDPTYLSYAAWCILEVFFFACFGAMYMALITIGREQYSFFYALPRCLIDFFGVLVLPYLLIEMGTIIYAYRREKLEPAADDNLVRFKDANQKLKLAVAASSLLYVEANENYVNIVYLDGESVKKYQLRSSMKRLEEMLHKQGLQRCQRAFFVNPSHVTVLRKDSAGFVFADLDTPGTPPIPVSKTYYDSLSALL